jgi:hypothetical protein
MTLLADTNVSSPSQPSNGVWLGVWHHWKLQSLENLSCNHVILNLTVNNEMQCGPIYPHLQVEETPPLLKLLWFLWLYCCGHDGSSEFCIDEFFLLLCFELEFKSFSDSLSLSLATNDCFKQHSSVLC